MRHRVVTAVITSLGLASAACAQLQYKTYPVGGPVPTEATALSNAGGIIDVGTITQPVELHIYDSSGTDDDLGPIVIRGIVSGGRLRLKIVNQSDSAGTFPPLQTFSLNADQFIPVGLRNFGGIRFEHPTNPNDTSLRDNAIVAVAVQGDITGDIDAGQIWRIDALRSADNSFGGTISGTIRSRATNNAVREGASVAYVRAGRQLTGSVIAEGTLGFNIADENTWSNIDRIVVNAPTTTDPAMTGEIRALRGRIGTIFTTRSIGTPTAPVSITCAGGINDVATLVEETVLDNLSLLTPASIHANINTNLTVGDVRIAPVAFPVSRGSIRSLAAGGDFTGSLRTNFIGTGSGLGASSGVVGIVVKSILRASITADANLEVCDIMASSITGHIVVKNQAKGSIVAASGRIESVRIGFEPYAPPRTTANPYSAGFNGIIGSPTPNVPSQSLSLDQFFELSASDASARDGVIRAPGGVGMIQIAAMNQASGLFQGQIDVKTHPPRIESPSIDSLEISDIREGVIWSGNIGAAQQFTTLAGQVNINGSLGPGAAIWVRDFTTLTINGDVHGRIVLPSLEVHQTLRIGGQLGPTAGSTCQAGLCTYYFGSYTASDPRNAGQPDGQAPFYDLNPRIVIDEPAGLRGQIILNAGNTVLDDPSDGVPNYPAAWRGEVVLSAADPNPASRIVLSPTQTTESMRQAPFYSMPSAMLGGGAVGVVPFRLYEADCIPPHRVRETDPASLPLGVNTVLPAAFIPTTGACNSPVPVRISFYGPIDLVGDPEFRAAAEVDGQVCQKPFDNVAQSLFTVRQPGYTVAPGEVLNARTFGLSRAESTPGACVSIAEGKYRVRVVNPSVLSSVTGTAATAPAEFWPVCTVLPASSAGYYFRVGASSGCTVSDIGDFNGVGGVTVQDVFDFLEAWFSGDAAADVNGVGGVTVQDVFDFLAEWFNGCV